MSNEVENILAFYREVMEEMRERRRIEWQTFIIVNFFYLSLLKGLQKFDQGSIQPFPAIAVTIVILAFSWIWFIRIYGNAARFRVSQSMRNDINEDARFPYGDIVRKTLETQNSTGWRWWTREKKGISCPNWPFFGYRGICLAIILYCI